MQCSCSPNAKVIQSRVRKQNNCPVVLVMKARRLAYRGKRHGFVDLHGQYKTWTADWGLGTAVWGLGTGDWGLGTGDWGLGTGDWGLGTGDWGLGTGDWRLRTGDCGLGTADYGQPIFNTDLRINRCLSITD